MDIEIITKFMRAYGLATSDQEREAAISEAREEIATINDPYERMTLDLTLQLHLL